MIHLICPNPAIDRTLLTENFTAEVPNRPYEVKEFAGGKSFNVAYAMDFEDSTVPYCIHTILGGRNGDYLKELALKRAIQLETTTVDVNTRYCNIIVDTKNDKIYPVYENSFVLDTYLLNKFTQQLLQSIQPNDTVVFSGSLMKGMPADYINQIQNQLIGKNIHFFIDTSGTALIEAYKGTPDVIKINNEELCDLVPGQPFNELDDYIQFLKSKTAEAIPYFIITLGAKGVVAKLNKQIYHLFVPPIKAKNPIACGDFFLGGLVKYLTLGQLDDIDVLKKAISYSTANALNWFPEMKQDDIDYIQQHIIVEHLS
ncbi:1-phosphofructokinase family hexose kinase [Enterococcus quebecensis]|uniref:Tagatose-6-phosphate kinase n=1 Tax=Enterococcus quebecensis TaxID=903983 RepID=A0A1E5GU06_9ENTE|nr:PfkB family carbohydrate kinase [Enterococcus quebecensis]OEG15800.1 1-phosphofructokinase [Enterococcus quebecensis]OJG73617.1 1-phosphofructokinase family hexose kinase [Enterococcus quebecensis]